MATLESLPPKENYVFHHRKVKLQSFFQAWKRAYEQATPEPISKGIAVYAAFKWIEHTLDNRRRMPTDVYHFPRHIAKEKDGRDSEYFLSRLRDYVCRNMQVSIERIPYFVHSVALLDAFQMARTFAQWKWFHRQIKQMRRKQQRNRLRYFFNQWRIFNIQNEMLEDSRVAVSLSRERRLLKQSFRNWRVQMKAYFRQRVRAIPFRRRHAFRRWEIATKNREWQRYSIVQGRRHHLRRRMKVVLMLWLSQLCRLSQAKKVSISGEMKSWLLSSTKSRFFDQNTTFGHLFRSTVMNRSKFFTKHPLILRMLYDFAIDFNHDNNSSAQEEKESSSASVTRNRHLQALIALRRVIQVVRDRPGSKVSQRFLIQCATEHYRYRTMLSVTRKWMLQVVQRVLDHSTHDDDFRNEMSQRRSLPQRAERRTGRSPSPTHFRDCLLDSSQEFQMSLALSDLSPIYPTLISPYRAIRRDPSSPFVSPNLVRYLPASHPGYFEDITKTQIRFYVRRWRERSYRLHFLRIRAAWIQQQNMHRQKETIFGSWMVLAARYQHVARISNRVLNHRLQRDLYCAFFAWRHVYERAQLIHQNERQLLRIRSQEIKDFSDLYKRKVSSKSQGTVLKVWALFVRDRRRGKELINLWERLQYRLYPYHSHPLGRVFCQWKNVFNQDIIVTCFQRCWRGYQCRFLSHLPAYNYLKWYRRRIPSMFSLRRRHLLRAGWLLFRVHHALHRQRIVQVYQQHQVKRLFRRWWQSRCRHHLLARQVDVAKRRYWRQRQHRVFHYLASGRDRMHFLYRLVRVSRRVQVRFAIAQLRYAAKLRKRNREVTRRAWAKKFVHFWLRLCKQAKSSRIQRFAHLHTKYYVLRPPLRRWFQQTQVRQHLTYRSTTMMRMRKKFLYLRRWLRRSRTLGQLSSVANTHNRRRMLQRAFGQLLRRLLGEEFYRSGTMPLQQHWRRRNRRERRSMYHQQFQHYKDATLPRSLQLARLQRRPGGNFPGTISTDDGFASMDLRGHLQSRLYRGRVSRVSRSLLWQWRHWALRRRQYRKHVAHKLQIMKRRKKSLFFYYLLQMWRENHPNSMPGHGGSRKKKKQNQLSAAQRKRLQQARGLHQQHSHIVVHAQHRTRDKQQQRLAWKSYVKRAVQRRKQLNLGGGEGDAVHNHANLLGFHSTRAEYLCEIYGYFHRWIFYRQRRQRFQHLVKDIHLGYWQYHQKIAWKRWAVLFVKRVRSEGKSLRLAQQFWWKSVQRKALQRLIHLRNRRRMHRKSILWYTTVRKPLRTVFHAMQRLKERRRIYHRTDVLRFTKVTKKLRRRMVHFLERLKLLVYHRKYAKPARIVQTKERHRLRLQFRKLRTLCLRYPIRRKLKLLLLHRRRQQQLVAALRYWHHWTELQQQVSRVVRRFTLVPMYKHWLSRTMEILQARRVVTTMQAKQRRRILRACVHGWRMRGIYQQRLQLQAQVIEQRRCRKWKQAHFVQWIQALDQQILYNRFVTISAKHHIRLKKKFLRTWIYRAKENERVTYQNLLFGWQHWRRFVQRRRYYHHQQYQRAKVYDLWLRSMRRHLQVWILWTRRVQLQRQRRQFPSVENPLYRRQVQQKYQKYFRRWKRVMFLRHWHKEQHHHRQSSTFQYAPIDSSRPYTPSRSSSKLDHSSHHQPRVHWPDDSPVRHHYHHHLSSSNNKNSSSTSGLDSSASFASPQRPMSMSTLAFSHLASQHHHRDENNTSQPSPAVQSNSKYIDQVSRVHPASPFPEGTKFRRSRFDDIPAEDEAEDEYDVPYLSPERPKHARPGTSSRFTAEDMLSVDALAATRRSNATLQAINAQLTAQPLEPALHFRDRFLSDTFTSVRGASTHQRRQQQHLEQTSIFARHRHHSHAFALLRPYRHLRSNLVMIAGHQHYTIPNQNLVSTSGARHARTKLERYLDDTVPNSKIGLLHLYTVTRVLLHWHRIATYEKRSKQHLLVHRLVNAWRLFMLAQRLRREAFAHRLILFRRRQLAVHVSFLPWKHVVRTNRLGRALAQHRHQHLVRLCCFRWLRHQAQRAVIRAKWQRIPDLLGQRLLFPWAMKQWYIATHQRLAVAKPWITKFVWVKRWRALLLAKRFAKYHMLIQIWQAWQRFVAYRRRLARSFRRRWHLLHRIVHKHLVIKPRVAVERAWQRWQLLTRPPRESELLRENRGSHNQYYVRSEHNVLQSLCLSQAGQVMLFHNLRPLPMSLFRLPTPYAVTRKIPRVEKIRTFLWHRCIARLEIADERARREYVRRQRLYQRILQAQGHRDPSCAALPAYMDLPTWTTTAKEGATATTASRNLPSDQRSLRVRMAEVLTPGTSLGRYKSELSRTKVLEEAQSLKLHSVAPRAGGHDDVDETSGQDWYLHEQYHAQTLKNIGSPTLKWLRQQYIGLDEDVIAAAREAFD